MTTENHPVTDQRDDSEAGYIMAMTALLLIPLLIFAAFATDLGSWYVEGQRNQRTADAAALSGVVLLGTDSGAVTNAVMESVRLNGYSNAVLASSRAQFEATSIGDPPSVLVERTGAQEVKVSLRTDAGVFFGGVASIEGVRIERFAIAEYVTPVPMGNPTSSLGTGVGENFWLNILPPGWSRNAGDLVSSVEGERAGGGKIPNPNHDPRGYLFTIDVPTGTAVSGTTWNLQIRSTCFGQNKGEADYRLYFPDDTPFDDYDNVDPAHLAVTEDAWNRSKSGCSATGGWNGANPPATRDSATWVNFANVAGQDGRWVFQAKHSETNGNRVLYSLRIVDGAGNTCQRLVNPNCPTLSALNWMGAFTQSAMFDATSFNNSEIYLAEIGPAYAGNTLEILLFDPADGIDAVKVKDPFGNFVNFTWETIDINEFGYGTNAEFYNKGGVLNAPFDRGPFNQTCGGDSAVTAPTGTPLCDPDGAERSWFQDRTVKIVVPIPTNPCNGTNCWWKLVYVNNANDSNETTTWRARVIGDPVQLIE